MRFSTIVGIFTLMLTLAPGLVFAEHVIDDSKKSGYLFVIGAASGELHGDTLTLTGVPSVVYFSDSPARKSGHTTLAKFASIWDMGDDSFQSDPPNAVLSVLGELGEKKVTVELKSIKTSDDTVAFKVRVLKGSLAGKFGKASLFIDEVESSDSIENIL